MLTDLHRKPLHPGIFGLDAEGREVSIPEDPANPDYAALVDGGLLPPPAEAEATPLGGITRRQLRLTLLDHGLLGQVEPAIAALPEPERSEALIEWQDATAYRRDHPLIAQIGAALDLEEHEIDAMWIEALAR